MKKNKSIIFVLFVICLVILSACKGSTPPTISVDEVDKVKIVVKDGSGQDKHWEAEDQNFLKTLIGNVNLLFVKKDENAQNFSMKLTPNQSQFNYQIVFYKKDKIVYNIEISNGNKVVINKEEYLIKENKESELNSLKNHLLSVVQ
ncbi:hypothetical protein [Vagococcus fluvialis]|uniref:Lipoprotein n=1 Tax=Vagococcus fluvialis bH819 TaxID=1255619 RepID=A0A1X6WRP7_9ENTE|nr:hypothetical protein [Vagococcus fluvialis]SLM87031.1 hypothetical protein FM121_13115 [Vagococcus fluvialis bH819]